MPHTPDHTEDGESGNGGGGDTQPGGGDEVTPEPGNEQDDAPPANTYGLPARVSMAESSGRAPLYGDLSVTVADVDIPSVVDLTASGEGRQSQYLTEVTPGETGGDAGGTESDTGGSDSGDSGGTESRSGGSSGSGSGEIKKTPPLEITLECYLGYETMRELIALREVEDPFTVTIGDWDLDDMVLEDLQRELEGQAPTPDGSYGEQTYKATVVVKEYRETIIRIPQSSQANNTRDDQSSNESEGGVPEEMASQQPWLEDSDGDASGGGDFDTTTPDGTEVVEVGSDETLSNQLYDVSGDGAAIIIVAEGSNWQVRNIGVRGTQSGNDFAIILRPNGGSNMLSNVYLGDGGEQGATSGGVHVEYGPDADGSLHVNRLHASQWTNNGLFANSPPDASVGVNVTVSGSYFYSNNLGNIRVGTQDGTTSVQNSVVVVEQDAVPACEQGCSNPGSKTPHGLWAWNGAVTVTNSDIGGPITTTSGGNVNWQNSARGDDAERRAPTGVPLTPEAAAGHQPGGGNS